MAEGYIRVLGKEALCRGLWKISCVDEGQKAEGVCFRENFGFHFHHSCYLAAKIVHWTICQSRLLQHVTYSGDYLHISTST